jgi:hypothetical protein
MQLRNQIHIELDGERNQTLGLVKFALFAAVGQSGSLCRETPGVPACFI